MSINYIVLFIVVLINFGMRGVQLSRREQDLQQIISKSMFLKPNQINDSKKVAHSEQLGYWDDFKQPLRWFKSKSW